MSTRWIETASLWVLHQTYLLIEIQFFGLSAYITLWLRPNDWNLRQFYHWFILTANFCSQRIFPRRNGLAAIFLDLSLILTFPVINSSSVEVICYSFSLRSALKTHSLRKRQKLLLLSLGVNAPARKLFRQNLVPVGPELPAFRIIQNQTWEIYLRVLSFNLR